MMHHHLPLHYPHRVGKTYTRVGFHRRVRHNLARRYHLTECMLDKIERLYFGIDRQYLDDEGWYRRRGRMWELGRSLGFAYCIRHLQRIVMQSGVFEYVLDEEGEILAFRSPMTRRVTGWQMTWG